MRRTSVLRGPLPNFIQLRLLPGQTVLKGLVVPSNLPLLPSPAQISPPSFLPTENCLDSDAPHQAPNFIQLRLLTGQTVLKGLVVPSNLPLLPSPAQISPPSFLPTENCLDSDAPHQAPTAGKTQADVAYLVDHFELTPPPVSRPISTARKTHQSRIASPFGGSSTRSIVPIPTVPIQCTTDAAKPAPPLLGVVSHDAPPLIASTPAALPGSPCRQKSSQLNIWSGTRPPTS